MSNNNQTLTIDDLVRREVVLCVSVLIGELQAKAEHFPEYEDDLIALAYGPVDWEEAARDAGWRPVTLTDGNEVFWNLDTEEEIEADGWAELCLGASIDVDDYRQEAFEHWVVSSFLAADLVRHGETVVDEILGIGPIWARTTSGQAIAMDGVIEEIYSELMRKNR